MSIVNNPIAKKTLGEVVASRIKQHIINNKLKAGDRLPTEQEMAESFQVSRLSVREATKALSFLGIIDSAPRRGLVLAEVDIGRLSEYLGFHFALNDYPKKLLLQARTVIEVGVMSYCVRTFKKDPTFYKRLSDICDELESCNDVDIHIEKDFEFHSVLVRASEIEPLIAFNDLLQAFFKKFREEVVDAREVWKEGMEDHRKILALLNRGQATEAEDCLKKHFKWYRDVLEIED